MSVLLQTCNNKHIWKEIESDNLGRPTKYKCVNCPQTYEIKKHTNSNEYFDKRNSIFNKMKENIQKIAFILLNPIGTNEKIHLEHLSKENAKLREILNQ